MRFSTLRNKISLFFVLVIVVLVTTSFSVAHTQVEAKLRELLQEELEESEQVFLQFQRSTLQQMQGKCTLVAHQRRVTVAMRLDRDIERAGGDLEERIRNLRAAESYSSATSTRIRMTCQQRRS